ncbi:AAA domain-containing protein [Halorussus lipolyticus]|uniref:AAA domain-containing protein n=1 Tax=Halorussus lipolyticus TaxID=3034024 RepID=UPI0023E79EEA|nr:AAA domain-containing protein [Halorussus sp. DT80]
MTSDRPADERPAVETLTEEWNVRGATLLRAKGSLDATTRFERNNSPAVLASALDRASRTVRETPPNRDGYAVPLHEPGTPVTTDEYVLWRPDSEQIGWYDTSFGIDGTVRFVSVEDAAETTIGDRLKYWHPDLTPEAEEQLERFELPGSAVEPQSRLSDDERREFFEEMYEFVNDERDAEQRANRQRHVETGIETLVGNGLAVGPFVSLGRVSHPNSVGRFQFQITEGGRHGGRQSGRDGSDTDLYRDEEIYPDSVFLVDTLDDADHFPLAVRTTSVEGSVLTVKADRRCSHSPSLVEEALTGDGEYWLTHLLNPVPFERRTEALDRIRDNQSKRDLLTGSRPAEFSADRLSVPSVEMELNEYQRQALKWADDAEDLLCIHGPPGTGKTRTLTAYVLHAVWHGDSVLVTAHSNQAVDNLLVGDSTLEEPEPGTLHEVACRESEGDGGETDSISIARVGHNSTNEVVKRNYENRSVAEADVVAATTSGSAQFDTDRFDVGVVDEATQASRPATAIVLDCSRKLILSGDHKQLPPYSAAEPGADGATNADDETEDEQTHTSLFEYLLERYGDDISVLLGCQYRMHDDIARFPNEQFYGGNLETADRNRNWQIGDLDPLVGIDVGGEEYRESGGDSLYNPPEAEVVAEEVQILTENGVAPEDVGVISMYRGQVGQIRSQLNRAGIEDPDRITVDTVDSFQGGEREAVVVSFVRSNDAGSSGFLELPDEGPRRLNVALTRARKRLVLVGDWETLSQVADHRTPENSCAGLYDDLRKRLARDGLLKSH